jgi:hypothetical protein
VQVIAATAAQPIVRRRRAVPLAFALAFAAVALASTVSYAASTGTALGAGTGVASRGVYTVAAGVRLPDAVRSLRYTTQVSLDGRIVRPATPAWRPVPGAIGTVERPGDIALVDTTGVVGTAFVTVHLTNLAELRHAYSSFALPLGVWSAAQAAAPSSWARVTTAGARFVTSTEESVTFTVSGGRYYDLTLEAGGTWATTSVAAANYSPDFYVTVR